MCMLAQFKGKKKNPRHLPGEGLAQRCTAGRLLLQQPLQTGLTCSPKTADRSPPGTGSIHGAQGEHPGRNLVPRWHRPNHRLVQGEARTPIWKVMFSCTQNPNFPVSGKSVPGSSEYGMGLCLLRRNKSSKTSPPLFTPGCLCVSVSSTQI